MWDSVFGVKLRWEGVRRGELCLKPIFFQMKRIFGLRFRKDVSPTSPSTLPWGERINRVSYQPGYHIRNKSLKKIHKAASLGNVAGVQHILLLKKNGLDDRDRKNR